MHVQVNKKKGYQERRKIPTRRAGSSNFKSEFHMHVLFITNAVGVPGD